MAMIHRCLLFSAVLSMPLAVAACGPSTERGALERRHCRAVLGFLNRDLGRTEIVDEAAWDGDGTYNVTLRYEVAVPDPDRRDSIRQRDTLQCRYAQTPSRPGMMVEVLGLHQRGVELDARQIRIVNTALKVFR